MRTGASASSSLKGRGDGTTLAELFVIVLCFILAALASGTETGSRPWAACVSRYLAEEGTALAHPAALQRDPNRFLSPCC